MRKRASRRYSGRWSGLVGARTQGLGKGLEAEDAVRERLRRRPCWSVVLPVVLVAGVSPVFGGGTAGAQAGDADATRAGARDVGDATGWSDRRVFDDEVDGSGDEVDYFAFSLSQPKLVGVGLRRLDFDADVFLEDTSGTVLASGENIGTDKEWISVGLTSGDYFLRVLAKEVGTNAYRLRLEAAEAPQGTVFLGAATIAGPADGSEGELQTLAQAADDSTREGAQDLGDLTDLGALGPVRAGQWDGTVRGTNDPVDYFAFSLSESKKVGAGLRGLNRDADIFLEDGSGTVLASSRRVANEREFLNATLAAGSYFIRVEAQDRYRIRYTMVMGTASPDSVATGFDTAAVVGVGSEIGGRIAPYWDIDWVRVDLVANHVYVLEVRGQDSQSGTLVDPELRAVYVDPADASVFDVYFALDRVVSDGRICDSGMTSEALALFPEPPDVAFDSMDGMNGHDFDDGLGQDAWLMIRADATGSHYIKIDSQGGFQGTYTVAAAQAGTFTPGADYRGTCPPTEGGQQPQQPIEQQPLADTAELVVNPDRLAVPEDGSGTFTVKLATQPSDTVTVTVESGDSGVLSASATLVFTTTTWDTPQPVAVTGVDDDDAADNSVTVTSTASSADGNYDGEAAEVTVTVTDDDVLGLIVNPTEMDICEDGTGSFGVRLATQPTADVTVSVSSGDTGVATVPATQLTFTTLTWDAVQQVTVSGVLDTDTDDEATTITVMASGGDYAGETAEVAVRVMDVDVLGLVVDPGSLNIDEDGTDTFDVWLATQPSQTVSVTVGSGDTGAATVPSTTLVFTTLNWETPQSVTVTGVDDADTGDETVTVTVSASGGNYGGETFLVTVTVNDDDRPRGGFVNRELASGLVVSPELLRIAEDGLGTFSVKLASRPSSTVSVKISSADIGAATVSNSLLVFNTVNWSTAQSVSVAGVDDTDSLDESVSITATALSTRGDYNGKSATVAVTVTDADTAGLVVNPGSLTVGEDGTGTFSVKLATQPSHSVSVTVASADTGAATVPSTALVFTTLNWGTAQSVAVTGVDDTDAGDETITITATAASDDGDYDGKTAEVAGDRRRHRRAGRQPRFADGRRGRDGHLQREAGHPPNGLGVGDGGLC